jgi:hypothetical protein
LDPLHYGLNRELAIQRKLRQQRNRAPAKAAQVTAHPNYAVEGHVHERALIESVARERLFAFALRAVIRAVTVGIGDRFGVLLDRAGERV